MIEAKIGTKLHNSLTNSRLGLILSNVKISPSSPSLYKNINLCHQEMLQLLQDKKETELEIIKETRQAYRVCGKEPSRYRPSAEALLRRIRTNKDLYRINNVVDTINLISISTQYSIGGFDFENIQGGIICDIGTSDPYEAIGRGSLNIEFMPGLKDSGGFFGTPTSDSVRTMVTESTTKLLLVFYDFFGNKDLEDAMGVGVQMLKNHCEGSIIYQNIVNQ